MKRETCVTLAALTTILLSATLTRPATAQVFNALQPGSVLVFPEFDQRQKRKTQLLITNTDLGADVRVQLTFICPGNKRRDPFCDALDIHISLTPLGTAVMDVAAQHPPCAEGYVMAIAEDKRGQPISFNALIGGYHISKNRRAEASEAIAIQSIHPAGAVLGTNGALQFGPEPDPATQDYAALGTNLLTIFRAVRLDNPKRKTELILLTLDSLAGVQNPSTLVFIDFQNAHEVPFSTSWEYVCWTRVSLSRVDFNFLEANLGSTHGSMTIVPVGNCPVPGGCPPFFLFDPTVLSVINENAPGVWNKRNLHHDNVPKSAIYFAH